MTIKSHQYTLPFSGWALSLAARLDQGGSRGLLADLFRTNATPLKRQAAIAVLAAVTEIGETVVLRRLPKQSVHLGEAIRIHTARELICAIYDTSRCSNSYLRALMRVGMSPLQDPGDYHLLYQLCSSDTPASRAVRYCKAVTSVRIHAALSLDDRVLSASVLNAIRSEKDCSTINAAIALLSTACSILETESGWRLLREHLAAGGAGGLARMLDHVDRFPEPPLVNHPGLVPITDARTMERVGAKFRNCLKSRTGGVVCGRSYYFLVEIEGYDFSVIAELEPMSTGAWRVHHLQGPKDCYLSAEHRKRVIELLMNQGAIVNGLKPDTDGLAHLFQAYQLSHSVHVDDLGPGNVDELGCLTEEPPEGLGSFA